MRTDEFESGALRICQHDQIEGRQVLMSSRGGPMLAPAFGFDIILREDPGERTPDLIVEFAGVHCRWFEFAKSQKKMRCHERRIMGEGSRLHVVRLVGAPASIAPLSLTYVPVQLLQFASRLSSVDVGSEQLRVLK